MRVFVSSTFKDLAAVRADILDALHRTGSASAGMEYFGARPELPLEVCLQEVRRADLFLLVMGATYGSVHPTSGLSFTHLEYREAVRNKIPTIVVVLRLPPDQESQLEPGLRDFRQEVMAGGTVDWVDDASKIPARAVAAILQHVARHGLASRARVFLTREQFFGPLLDPGALFNLAQPLVGRESVLKAMEGFLSGDAVVGVLEGDGGIGKSKLLYECALRGAHQKGLPAIRFLSADTEVAAEAFQELPLEPVCIIVDDAHRMQDLDGLLLAAWQRLSGTKFLLASRPSGKQTIDRVLSSVPEARIVRWRLSALERSTDALALARQELEEYSHLAEQLVLASAGNALVITIGAACIKTRKIEPDLLARQADFQRTVLDRLLDGLPVIDGSPHVRDRLLAAMAAIGPIRPGDVATREALGKHLGLPGSTIADACGRMIEAGVLFRKGPLARIVPDVLADHLFYRAAVTITGESTGFVDELASAFAQTHLSNLLANAAELEWRSQAEGKPVDVLEKVWKRQEDLLPTLSFLSRKRLLEATKPAAIFAPSRILRLVRRALALKTAPPEDPTVARLLSYDYQDVERVVPFLLRDVALHPDLTRQCCQLLWDLAKHDDREPNPHPDHPLRVLQDLASYQVGRSYAVISEAVESMADVVTLGSHRGCRWAPADVLSRTLEREGELMEGTRKGLRLGAFPVDPRKSAAIRARARQVLFELGMGQDVYHASRGIDQLIALLSFRYGRFGRVPDAQENEGWEEERQSAEDYLKRIASQSPVPLIRYLVWRRVKQLRDESLPVKSGQASRILGAVRKPESKRLYDAMLGPARDIVDYKEYESQHARLDRYLLRFAGSLWVTYSDAAALVGALGSAFDDLVAVELSPQYVERLFQHVLHVRPGLVRNVLTSVLAGHQRLAQECMAMLVSYCRSQDDLRDVLDQLHTTLREPSRVDLRQAFAGSIRYAIARAGNPDERDLRLIEQLAADDDDTVRSRAFRALNAFSPHLTKEAIRVLISADLGGSATVADAALSVVDEKYGIRLDELSDADVDAMLRKIETIDVLQEHHYHVSRFLTAACRRRPAAVVRMLLARISAAAQAEDRKDEEYRPLPYVGTHYDLSALGESDAYEELLGEVLAKALEAGWAYRFWVPKLFDLVATNPSRAVDYALGWAGTQDPQRVASAALAMSDMDHTVVFANADKFADLLERARRLGNECYESVSSSLFRLAVSGTYGRSPGEPSPRFVTMSRQAEELADSYQVGSAAKTFFGDLHRYAEDHIRSELAQDEEEDLL